jgi:hypothetical protein
MAGSSLAMTVKGSGASVSFQARPGNISAPNQKKGRIEGREGLKLSPYSKPPWGGYGHGNRRLENGNGLLSD